MSEHPRAGSYSRLELAIVLAGFMTAIVSGIWAYRSGGPYGERNRDDPRVVRMTDPTSPRMRWVVFDADGDGRFDTRCLMDGNRLLRMEIDDDGDGRMDRWQSYEGNRTPEPSSLNRVHVPDPTAANR